MPTSIILQELGILGLIVWSLAVLCLVVWKIRREGFAVCSIHDWTESGVSTLISLLPKDNRPITIPLMILTPIVSLGAIFWH